MHKIAIDYDHRKEIVQMSSLQHLSKEWEKLKKSVQKGAEWVTIEDGISTHLFLTIDVRGAQKIFDGEILDEI